MAENEVVRSKQVRLQPMLFANQPNNLSREVISAQQGGVWQYDSPQQAGQTIHVGRRHFISRAVGNTAVRGIGPHYELFEVLESGAFILLQQQAAKNRVVKSYRSIAGVRLTEVLWIPEWHSTYFLIAPDGTFRQLKKPVSEIIACAPLYYSQMAAAARTTTIDQAFEVKQLVQTLNALVDNKATAP